MPNPDTEESQMQHQVNFNFNTGRSPNRMMNNMRSTETTPLAPSLGHNISLRPKREYNNQPTLIPNN